MLIDLSFPTSYIKIPFTRERLYFPARKGVWGQEDSGSVLIVSTELIYLHISKYIALI